MRLTIRPIKHREYADPRKSSITPGTVLVNVFDENDKVVVSSDSRVRVTVGGNANKIYVVDENSDPEEYVTVTLYGKQCNDRLGTERPHRRKL